MVDAIGFDHGQRERVFGFGGGETERALQRRFPDRFLRGLELGGLEDAIEHGAQLGTVRQAELDVGDFMFEFGREFEPAA